MNEFSLIERYFQPLSPVLLKDDAAVLSIPAGHELVVSSDTLNEGTHFIAGADPADIAHKALRVNLSDLAAMGADPLAYQLNIAFSAMPDEIWLEAFTAALAADQAAFGIFCSGGDTTSIKGPLSISITAMGVVPAGQAVTRGGAEPGDVLLVSGPVGGAFCGLQALQRQPGFTVSEALIEACYRPCPRTDLAEAVRMYAHAAVDISDGLVADLSHICEASGVKAVLEAETVPLSEEVKVLLRSGAVSRESLLSGGDDYQLLMAVPPQHTQHFPGSTVIGRFEEGAGVRVQDVDGQVLSFKEKGWTHF
ncbi:MAG: thiamine-phosphate kinase [Alphaproteobacteria bacterium]|nr:thiamine-phosphate kinase [Alphaproteobacteria bacterium]